MKKSELAQLSKCAFVLGYLRCFKGKPSACSMEQESDSSSPDELSVARIPVPKSIQTISVDQVSQSRPRR